MLAPLGWDAAEIQIKAGSEHTINEIRYDLELQIFHKPREETEECNADDDDCDTEEVEEEFLETDSCFVCDVPSGLFTTLS